MAAAAPLVVVWRATERCNLACAFCAFDRTLVRSRDAAPRDDAIRFIDLLSGLQRPVLLSWLGGEPMLWPHLQDATRHAAERGLRVSLTTNGLALSSPRWRKFALETLSELTVSIDGPAEVHDRFRGQPGQRAMLFDSLRALRAERTSHLELKVNTVLLRENIEHFAALCAELAELGIDALTFNALGGNDRPEFHAEHHATTAQLESFVGALPELQRRSPMRILGDSKYLQRLLATSRGERVRVDDCGPGNSFWFIDAQGTLSPCSFTGASLGIPITSLRSVDDLRRIPGALAERRRSPRPAACDDCQSTQVFSKFTGASP